MKPISLLLTTNVLASLFVFFGLQLMQGQNLLQSEAYGRQQYIYKLSNDDAKAFFQSEKVEVKPDYFKTLVDSFPYGETYKKPLQPGYYLKVKIVGNTIETALTSVHDFEVFLLNNDTDLNIRILDEKANTIKTAKVTLEKTHIPFDQKTQSYSIRRSYKEGLLTVKADKSVAYFNLKRSVKAGLFKRRLNQALYQTPIRYIWRPVNFIVDIPVSAFKTIKRGYATGSIYKIKQFSVDLYESVACWFDDYYCHKKNTHYYAITDKPKYRPGDTLKFKTFVLDHKLRPLKESLELYLSKSYKDNIKLTTLLPYADGGYAYNFQLNDSLNLTLDKDYNIILKDKKGRTVAEKYFKYEEYSLKGNTLKLFTKKQMHYKGDSLHVNLTAKDENELFLMDARAEITVTSTSYGTYFEEKLFIPDVLWTTEIPLKPREKTRISIPPEVFPIANFNYKIVAVVKTSDNETITEELPIQYMHQYNELEYKEQNDTLVFTFLENGKQISKPAKLSITNAIGTKDSLADITLPYKLKPEPAFSAYTVETDSLSKSVKMSELADKVNLSVRRTLDSIHIKVYNPRQIEILYTLYKVNKEMARGSAKAIEFDIEAKNKKNYVLSLAYIWGGVAVKKSQQISINENKLNLEVKEPQLIYPGKKDTISIRVTDYKDKPVEGVDVTAVGLTKKFNYTLPVLPGRAKRKKSKYLLNNYAFEDDVFQRHTDTLNYAFWKQKAKLDSIIYYDFMYPKALFITDVTAQDNITQFAPFVMKSGEQVPIHVVYVDNNPVYFSWNTHRQSYSFKIDSGYHNIKLRTPTRSIRIDSLYFKKGRKTIFSLQENTTHKYVSVVKRSRQLTYTEQRQLYPRILVYKGFKGRHQAFVESRGRFYTLDHKSNYYNYRNKNSLTGPVYDIFRYEDADSLTYKVNHEAGYSYAFGMDYLKLKSFDYEDSFLPKLLDDKPSYQSIFSQATTLSQIQKAWKKQNLEARKRRFNANYPEKTEKGFARLIWVKQKSCGVR